MGLADLTRQYFPASGNVFPLFFRRRKAAKKTMYDTPKRPENLFGRSSDMAA
jgi:hypothetical protein